MARRNPRAYGEGNGKVEYMIPIQTPDVPTKETNLECDDDLIENDETNKLSIDFENTLHISDKVIRRDEQNDNQNIKNVILLEQKTRLIFINQSCCKQIMLTQ